MFLQEAESSYICRKLQLKDMIPVEMQRLVKYPLLLECILKHTQENSAEYENVKKALEFSKQILETVNTAKRNSENLRRLEELQHWCDTGPFDKVRLILRSSVRIVDLFSSICYYIYQLFKLVEE